MKIIIYILLLAVFTSISVYSQDQKIKVGLQYGFLNGGNMNTENYPDYTTKVNSQWGWRASADISYFITNRFFVTANISEGAFNYTSDRKYKDEIRWGNEYGVMNMISIGLLAGYKLPLSSWSSISAEIGFAQFNFLNEYYANECIPNEDKLIGYEVLSDGGYGTVFSASIPVKFTIGFTPFKKLDVGYAKNIEIGYACGLDIEPDFGFFTFFYHGPRLSISF